MQQERERRGNGSGTGLQRAIDVATHALIGIGESRAPWIALATQPIVLRDFVTRVVKETGMPWESAALHPFLNFMGGLTPLFSRPLNPDQITIAMEAVELRVALFGSLITIGAAGANKVREYLNGGTTINDPDALIYLAVGKSRPEQDAQSFGMQVQLKTGNKGTVKKLYFAAIYPQDSPKPRRPGKPFQRRFCVRSNNPADTADFQLIHDTGSMTAPTVILDAPDARTAENVAYNIYMNHDGNVRIIPVIPSLQILGPLTTVDIDTKNEVVLTEEPVNPYSHFVKLLSSLTDKNAETREKAAAEIASGVPTALHRSLQKPIQELRREKIQKLAKEISERPSNPRIYLHGSDQTLTATLSTFLGQSNFDISTTADDADMVVTFNSGGNDLELDDMGEEMKDQLVEKGSLSDKLHFALYSKQSNEDSASNNVDAGISTQRLLSAALVERVENDLKIQGYSRLARVLSRIRSKRSTLHN